ncbi:hypothetical protein RFI_39790, partial [Reticulomyxa filosa]
FNKTQSFACKYFLIKHCYNKLEKNMSYCCDVLIFYKIKYLSLITKFIFIKQKKFISIFYRSLREIKKKSGKESFIIFTSSKIISRKKKTERRYVSLVMKVSFKLFFYSKEEEIQIIIHHWIRTFNIQLGWIKDFDKLVVNYVSLFVSSSFHQLK